MANMVEEAVAEAVDAVKADVIAGVKNHQSYAPIVAHLVEQAIAQLAALVA